MVTMIRFANSTHSTRWCQTRCLSSAHANCNNKLLLFIHSYLVGPFLLRIPSRLQFSSVITVELRARALSLLHQCTPSNAARPCQRQSSPILSSQRIHASMLDCYYFSVGHPQQPSLAVAAYNMLGTPCPYSHCSCQVDTSTTHPRPHHRSQQLCPLQIGCPLARRRTLPSAACLFCCPQYTRRHISWPVLLFSSAAPRLR